MPAPNLANVPDVFWPALGGGIGGGIAILIVEIFRWYVNKPTVRCKLFPGFRLDNQSKTIQKYLSFEAINPHLTPVTLSSFGLLFKRKEWGKCDVDPKVPFPYQLDGGKSLSQKVVPESLFEALRKNGRTPKDLRWVYFRASSGKLYRNKIPKWVIKELEKEFYKLNESESSNT
jgi:hypothetical protein